MYYRDLLVTLCEGEDLKSLWDKIKCFLLVRDVRHHEEVGIGLNQASWNRRAGR